VRFNKLKYFKRYVEPLPFFLPVNLISMWAPLLSLTMRLFGNALAGWTLMTLIYGALGSIGSVIFEAADQALKVGGVIAPFITPPLHAYFDLFSGLIQTVVFLFLSMIFIANEGPEDDIDEFSVKGGR
jgi:F-type H+-transporting ATPase subunit a